MAGAAQMSILQSLPFSLCQPGPEKINGIGNFYLQVYSHEPSDVPLATLFFLDSHGQLSHRVPALGYEWINQTQIDWFTSTSQLLRRERESNKDNNSLHLSLAFQHIPLPEYGDRELLLYGGSRGEPTEGPKFNSRFYDALVREGVVAMSCGHDHVNDFCGLLPRQRHGNGESQESDLGHPLFGPWLCQAGGSGFGGYGSYGENRYHRRARVWEFRTSTGSITTWKRVEYAKDVLDELLLVEDGTIVPPPPLNKGTAEGILVQPAGHYLGQV